MAGTAITTRFMLGAATLMLGPQSALWDLQPSSHSLGLVKNVTMAVDPTFVDLTQGVRNSLVYSMMTSNNVKISAEVFEFSAKNLTYGLALDGTSVSPQTVSTFQRSTGIDGNPTPTVDILVNDTTGFSVGDNIMVIPAGADDQMIVRTISAIVVSPAKLTVTHAIGIDVPVFTVSKVNLVSLGDTTSGSGSVFLAAKIAGQLADGTPAVAMFPRVKVTKGFNMAFNSEQYGNLPYEIQVYDPLPSDTFYADFTNRKGALYTP